MARAIDAMMDAIQMKMNSLIDKQHEQSELNKQISNEFITRRKAEDKNRELQNSLLQSQKMEAIGLLAGGVAHDFNNILTVINGNAQLMKMDLDKKHPHIDTLIEIEDAGNRAQGLTGQLLAFSRKQVLQPKIIQLNDTIGNMTKMLKRLIGAHIKLDTDFQNNLPTILADPGQLEQVVLNLVVNARDAMPEGGIIHIRTMEITLESANEPFTNAPVGKYACLRVTDGGSGISKENMKKVFEPFFTTKPRGKGTGLGLATVFGIIKQSAGFVDIKSEEGEGTEFSIIFPIHQSDAPESPEEWLSTMELMGNENILVVEDDTFVSDFIIKSLKRFGYSCEFAPNGKEALNLIEKTSNPYDLILTDIIMPEMNGYILAEDLKKNQPDTKILYMSGYTDDSIIPLEKISKLDNFIHKPFNSTDLIKKIRTILNN